MKIMFALQAMNWVIHFTSFESQCFSLFFSTAQQCFKPYFKNLRRLFIIIIIDRSFYKWIDFLIILADLNNAMVFTILTHPCTSNSSNFDSRVFSHISKCASSYGQDRNLDMPHFSLFQDKKSWYFPVSRSHSHSLCSLPTQPYIQNVPKISVTDGTWNEACCTYHMSLNCVYVHCLLFIMVMGLWMSMGTIFLNAEI